MFDMRCFAQAVRVVSLVVLDQSSFWATSTKPTMLLYGNCDASSLGIRDVHEGARHTCLGKSNGEYNTKKLAAYPPLLNAALAGIIAATAEGLGGAVLILFSGREDAPGNLASCLRVLNR